MVGPYKQQLDNMMQREITRGEFLKYTGVALLGLFGVVGFIKNLHDLVPDKSASKKSSGGYGGSAYGR